MKISIYTQKIKNPLYQALDNYIRMLCMKNQPILITTAWEKLALLKRREGRKSEKVEKNTFFGGICLWNFIFMWVVPISDSISNLKSFGPVLLELYRF